MASPSGPGSRKVARAKTALRSKRSFILHDNDNFLNSTNNTFTQSPETQPLNNHGPPEVGLGLGLGLHFPQPASEPSRWERVKTTTREKLQTCRTFVTSDLGKGMFKCALAYLLGSMYTYIPFFNILLDKVDSKHVAATITVYFHPARTRGSALKALVVAFLAFMYTASVGLASMGVSVLFTDYLHQVAIGHAIVLIVFVGGGLGFVGWVKLTHSDPLINIACSLTNLSLISVLTKEGAVQAGDLSFGKIGQYLKMIVAGVIATTIVALFIFPTSGRQLFKKNMVDITDTMSDMLGLITSSFISGDEAELESKDLAALSAKQRKLQATLNGNVADAKIELNLRGFEAEAQLEAKMLECVQRIAQGIGGLRSAALMQFFIVKEPRLPSSMIHTRTLDSFASLATSPARTPLPDRTMNLSAQIEQIFGSKSPTVTDNDNDTNSEIERMKSNKFRSTQQIFELFIEHLGPSMRSLAYTLKEILDDLPFDADDNYAVANNPRFRVSLERALALYRDTRQVALESVYNKKHLDRNRPLEVEADWEEAAASCGQFSYCLLAVAEQVKEYLVILDDLEAEIVSRPDGRTWSWLKFWKWKTGKKSTQDHQLAQQDSDMDASLANDYEIRKPKPKRNAYERSVQAGFIRMNFKQRVLRRIYDAVSFLRRDDKKFFVKVGFGAVLYALPSYIPATRPFYTHWRGEWGLLSYMLVCSMTIGASNTTGWQRSWGTCLGAALAITAWHVCNAHAVPLAIFGFIMAYWTAYVILGMGMGPLGRFIMLTYNLSALYAYNLLIIPPDGHNDEEDSSNTPEIVTIALHRTVAVLSGCVWGLIITRAVWPISARRKLKDGLSLLWLRMGLIWRRDPLSVFTDGESQESYTNLREENQLQAFLGKLNALVAASKNEFVLRRPFPAETYTRILRLCSQMLDAFHQMHIVIERDANATPGERALLEATSHERDQLCSRLSHQFSVLASSMKLEYSIANDALPNTEHTRDRLLAKIFAYRKTDADERKTLDEDYSVLYTYALVTGQIGVEIQECLKEIESLFGVLDEESLWLQ